MYYMRLPDKELATIDKARKYIAWHSPSAWGGIMYVSLKEAKDYLESWTTPSMRWSDDTNFTFVGWGGCKYNNEINVPFPLDVIVLGEL